MKVQCPKCGYAGNIADQLIPDQGRTVGCPKCSYRFFIKKTITPTPPPTPAPEPTIETQAVQQAIPEPTAITPEVVTPTVELNQPSNAAKCPRCGSTSIGIEKQGFGGKKAGCGCCLLGPLGLLAGFFGSGKSKTVCMNCGHKWETGSQSKQGGNCASIFMVLFVVLFLIILAYCVSNSGNSEKPPIDTAPPSETPEPPSTEFSDEEKYTSTFLSNGIDPDELVNKTPDELQPSYYEDDGTPVFTGDYNSPDSSTTETMELTNEGQPTKNEVSSGTVYITNTGSKYHRGGCKYLTDSRIPISRDEAIKQGYEPCSVCNP